MDHWSWTLWFIISTSYGAARVAIEIVKKVLS